MLSSYIHERVQVLYERLQLQAYGWWLPLSWWLPLTRSRFNSNNCVFVCPRESTRAGENQSNSALLYYHPFHASEEIKVLR